jgi:methionyl-tRNA synthetase
VLYLGNNQLSEEEFWNLAKTNDEEGLEKLQDLLYVTFEITRISSILLMPFCPSIAECSLASISANSELEEGQSLSEKVQFNA